MNLVGRNTKATIAVAAGSMRASLTASFFFLAAASLSPAASAAADLEQGKEIFGTCAACHGDYGQGGKHGEYPRLAGQRSRYLKDQLRAFRARSRINIPMYPYTQERELSDEDIENVSEYIASVELPTKVPDFKDSDDALTRLLAMEKVMIISRTEGNVDKGKTIYANECVDCHKHNGHGSGHIPMVVGQYTNYLMKQIACFVKKERPHDDDKPGGVLNTLKEEDIRDVVAYLTVLQYGDDRNATR